MPSSLLPSPTTWQDFNTSKVRTTYGWVEIPLPFNPDARAGLELFETHCSTCHSGPQLSSFAISANGLPTNADYGRMNLTNNAEDSGAFKIPTLRGIALTYPYMHDGSYADLDTVLWTYSEVRALGLTAEELAQLKAF